MWRTHCSIQSEKSVPTMYPLSHQLTGCSQSLDTNAEFPFLSDDLGTPRASHAMAKTLYDFLDALAEPVIPVNFQTQCVQVQDRTEAFQVRHITDISASNGQADQRQHSFCSLYPPVSSMLVYTLFISSSSDAQLANRCGSR